MTEPDEAADRRLDANAAAGPLAELFTVDLTVAVVTCAGCAHSAPLAAHPLYADAPALVVRCPTAPVSCCATPAPGTGCDWT